MEYIRQRIDITRLLLLFISLACFSLPAMAQDDTAILYESSGAWQVGPASLGQNVSGQNAPKEIGSGNMPCVVANQFGNGFILRLSGGGGRLMAMAIDFQQSAFEPRRRYEVEFSVPGLFFQAFQGAAYDQQILLFGLQDIPEFYEALKKEGLKNSGRLVITVAGASVALDLTGLGDGFARMEQCYAPTAPQSGPNQKNAQQGTRQDTQQNPLIAREAGLIPMPGEEIAAAVPPANSKDKADAPDLRLSVDAVLNDVARNMAQNPAVAKGGSAGHLIAKAQEAEEAAKRLAAQEATNHAAPVDIANAPDRDREQKIMRPHGAEIMEGEHTAGTKNAARKMRFRALKGANLQNVLQLWADGAGIGLMWLSDRDFPVLRSLSLEGTLETALGELLEQYDGDGPRPVGRLYREPGSTSLVLVVERR